MVTISEKIIAIMGASGAQGGAVIKAFNKLGRDEFKLRAISRDPDSDKAKAILPLVDEFFEADADDEESMVKAFEGCYGAFIMSNFWQDMDAEHEIRTLRTCKEAAKKAGLQHVVLSSLEDTREIVNASENKDTWKALNDQGMYVPHFDGKGSVNAEYLAELPCTILYTCAYMENFTPFWAPTRQSEQDDYAITLPIADKKLALVAVEDIGKRACTIFLEGQSLIGKTVGVMSDALTGHEIAASFTKVTGKKVKYNAVPPEVYASFGFPGAADLANMFRVYVEHDSAFMKARELTEDDITKMGGLVSFEDFLTAKKDTFNLS